MVAGISDARAGARDPHIRPLDAWRDGTAVADLLEMSFKNEGIDESGQRMIHMLRHFSPLDALAMDAAAGLVWSEDGQVLGNVSLQRNPARRDTWMIGNVATHPAHRNRGISTALMNAAVRQAAARGARWVALQVVEGNAPALRVYGKVGFTPAGAVAHYRRPSVRILALPQEAATRAEPGLARPARWRDQERVWQLACANVPDELTYAEPFDASMYRLNWRWWLSNFFDANRELWLLLERGGRIAGAARTRVNYDLPEHHVELMLDDLAGPGDGTALLAAALRRFTHYLSKPLYCAQSSPHEASQAAIQSLDFKPIRTLIHMRLRV